MIIRLYVLHIMTAISNNNSVVPKNLVTVCTSEEADSQIIRHAIFLGVNDGKEVLIPTVDSDVVVLSFGYAIIVKDVGVERFYVVYKPTKSEIFWCVW